MSPLDFLRAYDPDRQALLDGALPASPLRIEDGDCVGVVLFNLGGPASLDEVEPFLYNLLMDPALLDVPVGGRLRHWLAKSVARLRAGTLRQEYEMIGGGAPVTRLAREQAEALEGHLNARYGEPIGARFRTFPAMRYGQPSIETAASRMAADGVDKVVLLPSYPQYSTATTGSAFAYWMALADAAERPSWPTTAVQEYAANPKYLQAVSERIDEALQRFPQDVRDEAVLVFSAHDTALRARSMQSDPYCCHVHSTVEQVMRLRGRDRPFYTAFQSLIGPNRWLSPATPTLLETLAEQGRRSVLVVPISFVTDHVNTTYELDIAARAEAERRGVEHFEVTAGLNTHPLFIEALGEATIAQLDLSVDVDQARRDQDGQPPAYPLRSLQELPRHDLNGSSAQCPTCGRTTGARQWARPDGREPNVSTERPAAPPNDPSGPAPDARSRKRS